MLVATAMLGIAPTMAQSQPTQSFALCLASSEPSATDCLSLYDAGIPNTRRFRLITGVGAEYAARWNLDLSTSSFIADDPGFNACVLRVHDERTGSVDELLTRVLACDEVPSPDSSANVANLQQGNHAFELSVGSDYIIRRSDTSSDLVAVLADGDAGIQIELPEFECLPGFYAISASYCEPCTAGSFCVGGSAQHQACPEGTVSDTGASSETQCH